MKRVWKANFVPEKFRMKESGIGIRKCDRLSIIPYPNDE